MGADNQREIELLIRAREIGMKSFDNTTNRLKTLKEELAKQVDQAEKGEASIAALTKTMKSLEKAGEDLISQQGLVDLYNKVSKQLSVAEAAADGTSGAFERQVEAIIKAGTATRDQERELERLAKADASAEKKVTQLNASLASQAVRLKDAGIPIHDLTQAQSQLANSAREVGTMLTATGKLLDGYGAHLEAVKTKADELATMQAFQKQAEDARKLQQASDYVTIFTSLLVAAEAQERELAEVQAFKAKLEEAKKLRKAAADLAFWNEQLDLMAEKERALKATQAFQQKGVVASAASTARDADVAAVAGAAASAKPQVDDFAKSIQAIIDPAGAARATLDGLESEVVRLDAALGDGKTELKDYRNVVLDLGKVQGALVQQAGAVSAFKAQRTVVVEATAAYKAARDAVEGYALAVSTADAPNDALAVSLKQAEGAATAAGRALEGEAKKLGALDAALARAGIDTNNLSKAEDRLRTTSTATAAAVAKLNNLGEGGGGGGGKNSKGFLGLRPYELQNLSYQINDVFTQLGSGASITQTFAQQGGQILQLFPNLLKAIIPFAPVVVVTVAVLGTLYAAFKRVLDLNASTRDFAKTLAASADGALYSARAMAQTAREVENLGVKAADAQAALKTFAKEGIAPERLEQFTKAAFAMSKVTGEDVPAAAKLMADGFTHGYDSVKKLDDQFDFLTAAERTHIRAMFESGNVAGARTAAFDAFLKKMGTGAEKARGPWAEAWRFFKNDFNSFLDDLSNSAPIQFLIDLLDKLAKGTRDFMASLPGSGAAKTTNQVLSEYGNTAAPANNKYGFTSSNDAIVKTAILEGGKQGAAAVMGVILNRMKATGASGYDITTAKGQFEAIDTQEGLKKLASIDTNSHDFLLLLASIEYLLKNPDKNPVGNATYFYSPGAQAALAARPGDNRSTQEGTGALSFAKQQNYVGASNGNKFYSGAYSLPGRSGGVTADTAAQKKAGDDYLIDLKRQLETDQKISDEARIQNAYLAERNKATEAGLLPAQIEEAAQAAKASEAWKVSVERAQEAAALASELNGAITTANQGQTENLDTRIDAITKRYDILRSKIKIDQARGGISPDGVSLDEWTNRVNASEQLAKNTETMKFYEQQLQEIEADRSKKLAAIQQQVEGGSLSAVEGVQAIGKLQDDFGGRLNDVVTKARAFAQALQDAHPDPKTASFLQMVDSIVPATVTESINSRLKMYQDAIAGLQAAQSKAVSQLTQGVQDDSMDALGAYQQAQRIATELNPEIVSIANEAAAFAESVKGAKPSPQLLAALEAFRQAGTTAARTSGPTTPQAVVGRTGVAADEAKLNDLISQRDQLLQTYNELQTLGQLSTDQLRSKSKALYTETSAGITSQIAKVRALVEELHAQHDMTDEAYNAWIAKLDLLAVKTQYVDPVLQQFKSTAQDAFVNGSVTGFDNMINEVGKLIDGTQSFGETLKNVGDIARTFFADFLRSIANLIIQMLALKAFEAIFGQGSKGGGLLSALASMLHTGGTVGGPAPMSRTNVSPMAWAGAPRYHTGVAGVGLRSDEVAAVLKKREEVLSAEDPRNILNGGAAASGGAGDARDPLAGLSIKNVNVFDAAELLAHAMSTKAGERIIMNFIHRNATAIRGTTG